MQVSWIDAERLKALVAKIAPPECDLTAEPAAVEFPTVATNAPSAAVAEWGAVAQWMEPATEAPSAYSVTPAVAHASTPPAVVMVPEAEDDQDQDVMVSEDDEHGNHLHNPAAALPLSRIRDKLRAIRQRATEAGILTRVSEVVQAAAAAEPVTDAPAAAESVEDHGRGSASETKIEPKATPSAPPFTIPHGSLEERLTAFAGWARQVLHEDGGHVLVLSDDGEVLCSGEANAGLVLSTMMVWGAAIRASACSAGDTPPVIRQLLASGKVLTVIPCETDNGMIHVAVAASVGLSDELTLVLRRALHAAMCAAKA